jgi:hypothetical protein
MIKTFDDVRVDDKVYLISIRDSQPYEFPKGRVIRELKAESIIRYPTSMTVNLSDSITVINPRKSMTYYIREKDEDEISLSIDVYALTKAECVRAANVAINERRTSLRAIEKRCVECDANLNNSTIELLSLDVTEEEDAMSEEEFANAALA